jgi:hypothetical protein
MRWVNKNDPSEPVAESMRGIDQSTLEFVRKLAQKVGLDVTWRQSDYYLSDRFFVMHGNYCLCESDDLGDVEFFIYGYTQGLKQREGAECQEKTQP